MIELAAIYRYIAGPDDAEFCTRLTELLNDGFELAGVARLTYDRAKGCVICGQPLSKRSQSKVVLYARSRRSHLEEVE